MKKVFLFVLALGFMFAGSAFATSPCDGNAVGYTQDVSSFAVSAQDASGFTCLISSAYSKGYIYHITASMSASTVAQKVVLYEKCNSTATATALYTIYIPSGTIDSVIDIPFTDASPLPFTRGIVVRKSLPTSDVQINILAR